MGARPQPDLALVLSGGGARAAYQVGLLRAIAKRFPDLDPPVLTGVSAGAINAVWLAAHAERFADKVEALAQLWSGLTVDSVLRVGSLPLARNVAFTGLRLISGGLLRAPRSSAFVDTSPLRELLVRTMAAPDGSLSGIAQNIERGRLCAVAVTASCYTTGQSITWVEGPCSQSWQRPRRRSVETRIALDHVMASAALPVLFPAVQIEGLWYGDGGIRLTAPLSPAIHLGAQRVLAISTRSGPGREGEVAEAPYPPPAQIAGALMDAIFLDQFDADASALERINRLILALPPVRRSGLRPVELLVLRPSRDLGRLANACEPRLPATFRFLTRGLGTKQAPSKDFLSLIMFQEDYLGRLLELGASDGEARMDEIAAFLGR
jgi:NTE family protein